MDWIPPLRFLLLLCAQNLCEAKIMGAYVLPHGGIALNPSQFKSTSKWAKQWAWQIHRASVDVGKHIRSLKPDMILLSTPHGVADLHRFTFYLNSNASGPAMTDNCECPPCCYAVSGVRMAAAESAGLAERLGDAGLNVSGLSFSGPPGAADPPAQLRWGEVVPLLFLKDRGRSRLLVLSHPSRRYNHSVSMIPEILKLGASLFDELESLSETVVVIASADLAHTHNPDGPYGFSPDAAPFDAAAGHWAESLHPFYLLDAAAAHATPAKSCGFTGLLLLHGLMSRAGLAQWTPTLHVNHHPSYYGMMVASFERKATPALALCPNCSRDRNRITT